MGPPGLTVPIGPGRRTDLLPRRYPVRRPSCEPRTGCRVESRKTPVSARPGGGESLLAARQYPVNQTIVLGFGRRKELVAINVLSDLLHRLVGVPGQHLFELRAHPQDLLGLDLDVRA